MAKSRGEKGQVVPILVIALSVLLIGAMGLAIDAGNLYQQDQLAQVAADAAATAAATSMFQGVNGAGAAKFSTAAAFTCTTSDAELPCQYARMNGFGGSSKDTVVVDFPVCSGCGYDTKLSSTDTPNQVRVTISRNVSTSIIQMVGAAATTPIKATAIAAIVEVQSPAPMIILHPTASQSLSVPSSITITGGPARSIQVNSSSPTAYIGGTIDLSAAGPDGKGADFGVFGGSYTNPSNSVSLGTEGHYISKASPIQDPFACVPAPGQTMCGVTAPAIPGPARAMFTVTPASRPNYGCQSGTCKVYSPGTMASLSLSGNIIFKPGVYYIEGGGMSAAHANGGNVNNTSACTGCADDTDTKQGILIYDTGASGGHTTGGFNFGTQNSITFQGPTQTTTNLLGQPVPAAPYYNIVFWEDRQAQAQTHTLGQGNGSFSVIGTIYMTNTYATTSANPAHFQKLEWAGNPSGLTQNLGSIIVDEFALHDAATTFAMQLVPQGFMTIRQVALVAGGPHP